MYRQISTSQTKRWRSSLAETTCGVKKPVFLSTLTLVLALALTCQAADPIDVAIEQLDNASFAARQKAVRTLVSIGQPVVERVHNAVLTGGVETRYRAMQVLIQLAESEDFATAETVFRSLHTLTDRQVGKRVMINLRQRQHIATRKLTSLGNEFQKNFTILNLRSPATSDPTLYREIRWIPALNVVRFRAIPVSTEQLEELQLHTTLQELGIFDSKLELQHVKAITELKTVQILYLTRAGLTADSIAPLAKMQQLNWLDLNGNAITDQAVKVLVRFQDLEVLDLNKTLLKPATVQKLREALPSTRILFEPN